MGGERYRVRVRTADGEWAAPVGYPFEYSGAGGWEETMRDATRLAENGARGVRVLREKGGRWVRTVEFWE